MQIPPKTPAQTSKKATIDIMQINANHSRAAMVTLAQYLQSENIDIALIQDPYLHNDRLHSFPGVWREFCQSTTAKYGTTYKLGHGKTFVPHENLARTNPNEQNLELQSALTEAIFGPQGDETRLPRSRPNATGNRRIAPSEVKDAVYSLNPKKAPSTDNIDIPILRNIYKANKALITDWVAKCFELGHFPEPLKVGQVVYFQKGKKDPTLPTSYRLICLL